MAKGEKQAAAAQGLMGDGARGERTGGTHEFVEYSILIAYRYFDFRVIGSQPNA